MDDSVITASCELTVVRENRPNAGPPTVTAKVTLKVAENKSFFAPRNVASLEGLCEVLVPNSDTPVSVYKIANSSALYKTRYVTLPFASTTACVPQRHTD